MGLEPGEAKDHKEARIVLTDSTTYGMLDIHPTKWEWSNGWLLPLTVLPQVCESQLGPWSQLEFQKQIPCLLACSYRFHIGQNMPCLIRRSGWTLALTHTRWDTLALGKMFTCPDSTFAYLSKVVLNGTYLLGFLSASRALTSVKMLKQCLTLGKYHLSEQFLVCSNCYPGVC